MEKRNPIILIHGLWNNSSIFSSITSKLDEIGIEYFAPTLKHSYGITSIMDLSNKLNELILEKYGFGKKISVKVYKHRNLVRNKSVVDKIIDEIIM